ncbi:4'-phosphopantetheinyl transferase [Rhizobium leguminosarum]|uniref:4'-phosphopantetheinyl transferase family protein n=1 Tax=Rhizobium leguminosarum TaxID=384 RepID=UPI003F9C271C
MLMIIEKAWSALPFSLDGVVTRRCNYRFLPYERLTHVVFSEKGWRQAIGGVFDVSAAAGTDSFLLKLPNAFNRAVTKRRAEHLAGRMCAMLATKQLLGKFQIISVQEDRSPFWPDGIVGSISHTTSHAVATVARSTRYQLLGIDVEHIVGDEDMEAIGAMVCSALDHRLKPAWLTDLEFVTLVFSAKEAFYKAVYPLIRCVFDFHEVTLREVSSGELLLGFREHSQFITVLPYSVSAKFAFQSQRCFCAAYRTSG